MTQLNLEQTILTNLIFNSEYTRKVIPYIKGEYFQDSIERIVFEIIDTFVEKYKVNPDSIEVIKLNLEKATLNEEQYKKSLEHYNKHTPAIDGPGE